MTMATEMRRFYRDSWPPTQVRLNLPLRPVKGMNDPRPLLEDIDENPLTYFLTPAPRDCDDDDEMDLDDCLDFDAGIEDASHPREMIRSVSPSSLEGLSIPKGRAVSPDFDSDMATTDDDDDEDYIRFSPRGAVLSPLRDLAIEGLRFRPRSPVFGPTANALLSPNSIPTSSRRGRTHARGLRRETRSLSARARPNHLWREPSRDVWSIEEETEEELMMSDMASDSGSDDGDSQTRAAKPKKRVRFVLPARG